MWAGPLFFSGIEASLFLEPEAFLQFLMFTEWSSSDREDDVNERVAGDPKRRNGRIHQEPGTRIPAGAHSGGWRSVWRTGTRLAYPGTTE